jgi:hypothetical protein
VLLDETLIEFVPVDVIALGVLAFDHHGTLSEPDPAAAEYCVLNGMPPTEDVTEIPFDPLDVIPVGNSPKVNTWLSEPPVAPGCTVAPK